MTIRFSHIGRSWDGTRLEDACPCPKAPCGLVPIETASEDCPEHHWDSGKSIRQSHPAERCPALVDAQPTPADAPRPTASTITDAQLDALYAERDRLAADLAVETELRQERTHLYGLWRDKTNELAPQLAAAEAHIVTLEHVAKSNRQHVQQILPDLERADAVIARVLELAERWWQHQDRRRPRAELLAALDGPKLAADS